MSPVHHRSIAGRILATGSDIDEDDLDMDAVRRRILARVKESRSDLRMASRAIGRNAAYLHQFIHRGTPRVLAENDPETLVEHLGCSPEELRHDRSPSADLQPRPPLAVPGGYCAVREIDARAAASRGPGTRNPNGPRRSGSSASASSGMNTRPRRKNSG